MFRRCLMVCCVLSPLLSSIGVAAATHYTLTTLNPAGADTTACGLALALVGDVPTAVGVTNGSALGLKSGYPCIWDGAGNGTNILANVPGSPTRGHVEAIDSSGDVVGSEYMGSVQNPFFLASGGTLGVTLPTLNTGDTYNVAFGVKDSSTVVGIDGPSYTNTQAAIWTKQARPGESRPCQVCPGAPGACTREPTPSTPPASWPVPLLTSVGVEDAVTWTNNGSAWVVNDLIDRSLGQNATGRAHALAVNSSGVAVGWSMLANFPDINQYAAIFSGGSAIDLALPYTGSAGRVDAAYGINDNGVVVGTSVTGNDTSSANDAFIYDATNGVRDMNTVFASIIPSGWTLTTATGIDNNGDIVGYMFDNGGVNNEGFLIRAWLPGDANGDGKVDINDLTIVLSHYGQSGMTWTQGEFTGDGTVDINDLTIVLAHYGDTFASSAAGSLSAVPEPGARAIGCRRSRPVGRLAVDGTPRKDVARIGWPALKGCGQRLRSFQPRAFSGRATQPAYLVRPASLFVAVSG